MIVEKLVRELGIQRVSWKQNDSCKADVVRIGDVILAKPLTCMNNSGFAVSTLLRLYKLNPSDIWIIHDDIDLPIGKIKIRTHGGSAGHHGVQSVIDAVKTDAFVRFRMGIGRGKFIEKAVDSTGGQFQKQRIVEKEQRHESVISFVLSRFTRSEAGAMKHLIKNGMGAVRIALTEGIDSAMQRYN